MDQTELIASIVASFASLAGSAAWPLAVAFVALLFQTEIKSALSRPLRRMKAWGVEAEWQERAAETATEVVRASAPAQAAAMIAGQESLMERLADVAMAEPPAAVESAFAELEKVLRQRLLAAGIEGADKDPLTKLLAAAMTRGLISAETVGAISGVLVLRNLAASRPDVVDAREALDYLAMADTVLFAFDANVTRELRTRERAAST